MAFYNIAQKANYYGNQLRTGRDKNGRFLTKRQKSFRAGFVKAFNNSARAYKSKHK